MKSPKSILAQALADQEKLDAAKKETLAQNKKRITNWILERIGREYDYLLTDYLYEMKYVNFKHKSGIQGAKVVIKIPEFNYIVILLRKNSPGSDFSIEFAYRDHPDANKSDDELLQLMLGSINFGIRDVVCDSIQDVLIKAYKGEK